MAGIQDRSIAWMRKRVFINIHDMLGLFDHATTGIPQGSITAGVTQVAVGSAGIIGYDMDVGEFVGGSILIPYDIDPKFDIGFKVHYTGTTSGTDGSNEWILLWKKINADAAYAVAATALDTVIGSQTFGANTDDQNKVSSRGILLPETHQITRDQIEDGAKLMFKLELQATANMDSDVFLGLEMDYVPQRCWGVGQEMDAPLKSTGV